jgi:hypothetical protein
MDAEALTTPLPSLISIVQFEVVVPTVLRVTFHDAPNVIAIHVAVADPVGVAPLFTVSRHS